MSAAFPGTSDARFRFRAATPDGEVVEGVLQARSSQAALEELRGKRLYPVELEPLHPGRRARRAPSMGRTRALALTARALATLLGAGVTLDQALDFAAREVANEEIADALRRVREDLRGGTGFASALERQRTRFGPLFVAMAAAGEESGELDDAMGRLADHLEEMAELGAQLRSSLLYPALMGTTTLAGTLLLLLVVVPRFGAMLADMGGTLPLSTRLLVGAGQLLLAGWWLVPLAALAVGAGARAWLARPGNRRRLHGWRLGWPVVGELETRYATARFTRVLGMMLGSGRPLPAALRVARGAVSNLEIHARLERAEEAIRTGERVHRAVGGTLPPLAAELIAVGEESGRLDELCLRAAESYEADVRRSLRAAVAVVEPALILCFAVIVGFVALAMLQAFYGINPDLP